MPIGIMFSLSLILGNLAYLYLSVSFIQMLKVRLPPTPGYFWPPLNRSLYLMEHRPPTLSPPSLPPGFSAWLHPT